MGRFCHALVAAAVSWGFASVAEAAGGRGYAVDGTLSVDVQTLDAATRVVVPKTGGPYPLIIASHGWSASGANQLGWAEHFATYGFVVAVPTFPSPALPDTTKNAGIIAALVAELTGPAALAHHVAPGKFGLEGHSAGGLATTVAAAGLSPAATVLFDPVDKAGAGKAAYASLCGPVLAIFAEASGCNQNAEWLAFGSTTKADLVAFKVSGSTHCDGENQARTLCGPFCGGSADPGRQDVYSHYATAFLLAHLAGDAAAAAALADAAVQADSALAGAIHLTSTCGPNTINDAGSHAGNPSPTASSSSTPPGSPSTSPSLAPGAASSTATPASAEGAGSGCTVASRSGASAAVLFAGALALLVRRRRSSSVA